MLLICPQKSTSASTGTSKTTKTTPYPKGTGLDSPSIPSGTAVLVGCWLDVVAAVAVIALSAAVAAAFGGSSGHAADDGVSSSGARAIKRAHIW